MPARAPACLAILALLAAPASAQRANPMPAAPEAVGESGGLVVPGIEVDETAKTNRAAREAGWRQAQRLAWPQLWARLSGAPPAQAPRVTDSALDQMVAAIEVEREAVRNGRYIARLAVVFDRARAAPWLGRYAPLVQSPPMLVLPVLQDAGTRMGYEPGNPWVEAWLRFRAGESAVDYVRLRANATDSLLLTAWQAERLDIPLWRLLMDRYQTADVLIPELVLERSHLGGPARARLFLRFGPSARLLARLELAREDGDIPALLDAAVREADRVYTTAMASGLLVPDALLSLPAQEEAEVPELAPELGARVAVANVTLEVDTPDSATLEAIERALRETPGVTSVRLQSFVIGGRSTLAVATALELESLARAVEEQGLRLEGRLLRRLRAEEAPPPPAAPAPPPDPAALPGGGDG
ncbi:heavy-metal-associated domain-containing protein [Thermaurantiacus tibetensis]|uniref:heavy-metal-associated domain-containing protein n=1 Tax=Thermaurantiacus tibetensis TaxID=2759035 RepID=UPI0018902F16|nr:heavy-metal-associated domain-containing protein [Thermaurantiacus tibetensis]